MMRRLWRRLLLALGIIKLYRIEYGGDWDSISAHSPEEALAFWRRWTIEIAGPEWLAELEEHEGPLEAVQATDDLDAELHGDDDPPGTTIRDILIDSPVPSYLASTIH